MVGSAKSTGEPSAWLKGAVWVLGIGMPILGTLAVGFWTFASDGHRRWDDEFARRITLLEERNAFLSRTITDCTARSESRETRLKDLQDSMRRLEEESRTSLLQLEGLKQQQSYYAQVIKLIEDVKGLQRETMRNSTTN